MSSPRAPPSKWDPPGVATAAGVKGWAAPPENEEEEEAEEEEEVVAAAFGWEVKPKAEEKRDCCC